MKRLLLTVALVLCLVGTARADWTAWGLYDIDTTGLRLGIEKNGNELGLYGAWRPDPEEPPSMFGIYGVHNFGTIEVDSPIPVSWLPAKWTATPYVGGYVTVDFAKVLSLPEDQQGRRTLGGPMIGIKFFDLLATELRYQLTGDSLADSFQDQQFVFALGLYKKF